MSHPQQQRRIRYFLCLGLGTLLSWSTWCQTPDRLNLYEFPTVSNGPQAHAADELDAFGRVEEAMSAAETISLAEAFARDYPKSQLLSMVLLREMNAEVVADSYEGAVTLGHKLLQYDPNNLEALVMMAQVLPNFPSQYASRRAQIVEQAQRYIRAANQLLASLHLAEGVSAKSFLENKHRLSASLRESAGFTALVAQRYEEAVREYEWVLAHEDEPSSVTYLRLGLAYYYSGNLSGARTQLRKAAQGRSPMVRRQAEQMLTKLLANHS